MATLNPYAPPRAAVADVDEEREAGVQPVKTWSAQGRVGRLRYLAHLMAAYLVVIVLGFIGGFLGAMLGSRVVGEVFVWVVAGAYVLFTVLKTIQRGHDMDWSGWTALFTLIPFVVLVWIFKAGNPRGNRFGAPAPPNTTGVRILGLIVPVIGAIGIVGLIAAVALPAYQQYVKRATANQVR
jgi:uncharacterized membrane protein YhaH (DUF805 family)